MLGQVTTWKMTPEELEEYKRKHPVIPRKKDRPVNFTTDYPDYKRRGKRGAESRWHDDHCKDEV